MESAQYKNEIIIIIIIIIIINVHLRVKTAWLNRVVNESNNVWNDHGNILNYQSDTKD